MVAESIKQYTKDHPYELRWRYDFDKTLISVCNINGDCYDKEHLSEEDLEIIEDCYSYLKSIKYFLKDSCCLTRNQIKQLSKDNKSTYIDYVNVGYPNKDGKTYSFKQYWETEKGIIAFDYEGTDAPLSEDGLFQFCDDTLPCRTRSLEDGNVYFDFRTDIYF